MLTLDEIYHLPRVGRRSGVLNPYFSQKQVWAAVAGAVVAAGTAVYSAQQQKKALKSPGAAAAIDPQAEQRNAIEGNLANQDSIEQLVHRTNQFNQKEAKGLMEQAMPGYGALSKNLTNLATNLSSNPYDVPADVQQNLERLSAEKGISTGRKGQAGQFSLLRDLGVNQLAYGQTAIGEAQGITGLLASIAPKVNPMSPMSMYLTPDQALNTASGNRDVQQGAMNADAAANNARASIDANMWGQLGSLAGGIVNRGITAYNTPTSNGSPTTYADYLRNNPNSSATGGASTPQVQTDWSFPVNKNGVTP